MSRDKYCGCCGDKADHTAGDCLDDEDMELLMGDSIVEAWCPVCGVSRTVETDAIDYECWEDGCTGVIHSPLVILGIM